VSELTRHLGASRESYGTSNTTPLPLPAGSASPVPDPDPSIPDAAPSPDLPVVIDLTTPPALAPVCNLTHTPPGFVNLTTTETPTTYDHTPTPPWTKRQYSPEREELSRLCGEEVHKIKGWQAVQGASPQRDTEAALTAITSHAPAASGMFGTYTPETTTDQASEAPLATSADAPFDHPLEFGSISPPIQTDMIITNNLPANEEPTPAMDPPTGAPPPIPSPLQSWHQHEENQVQDPGERVEMEPAGGMSPFHTNQQRCQLLETRDRDIPSITG